MIAGEVTPVAPSHRTALEERGGWRTAVTWLDGFGNARVIVEECASSHRMARRALLARFGESWPADYVPSLRMVARDGWVREYAEVSR